MTTLLMQLYAAMRGHFGPLDWWPGDSPWEIAVGAVLTQNTNWRNVEQAIGALSARGWLDPAVLAALPATELAPAIRPAGYFNVKARRLGNLARWWLAHRDRFATATTGELRESLLAVNGVGPETADSILLYALERPVFVVDAYTRRIVSRHGLAPPDISYHDLQDIFADHLPADLALWNDYHAQLVYVGKTFCRPTPRCADCPLAWHPHHPDNC